MTNEKEYKREKEGSNISKIIIDRELCIGAASCIAVSPETFKLNGENKAIVIDPNAASDEIIILAAKSCPTKAISLYDKEGKKIYP